MNLPRNLLSRPRVIRYPRLSSSIPSVTLSRGHFRRYATESSQSPDQVLGRRPVWIASICLGSGALAYACYDAYTDWRNLYPIEVRDDLKRGIAAKNKGDPELSAYYKRKAWETAISLPVENFKTEPYLRITGIAVDLAGEFEEQGRPQEAFKLYADVFNFLRNASPETLSGRERLRGVSLAVKLGQLSRTCAIRVEEEGDLLEWAVEEVLRLLVDSQASTSAGDAFQGLDLVKVKFPEWLKKTDVSVPLQELGDFYGRTGKSEYAMPLYLQGISLLVSDNPGKASVEDICQGAYLMNNIAEIIIRGDPTDERQKYAESWVRNALSVLKTARNSTKEPISTCEYALSAALYNAGMLRELAGDKQHARAFFNSALEQSKMSGVEEGVAAASSTFNHKLRGGIPIEPE
ncbi:hypothetical protein B0H10DRAFT_1992287 [Mycena sp. CBHHK59/15]|nr:hypothetical protein B0H10DRAFT_1992287 [Mycena sp. CBHHK59/15]